MPDKDGWYAYDEYKDAKEPKRGPTANYRLEDGPAHAKLPRDVQRGAVDATFKDSIRADNRPRVQRDINANLGHQRAFPEKGVKEATPPWDFLPSGLGRKLAMMGAGGVASVVARAGGKHMPGAFTRDEIKAHMSTQQDYPKLWKALKRDPEEFTVRNNSKLGPREKGRTEIPVDVPGGVYNRKEPIDIQYGPLAGPETPPHEILHGLLAARGKKGVFPRGEEILSNRGTTPEHYNQLYRAANAGGGGEDIGHAAVSSVADQMAHRSGYVPTPTTSIDPLLEILRRREKYGGMSVSR